MQLPQYLLAIDQGTTNSRAHLFNRHAHNIGSYQLPLKQFYPQEQWVEQSPLEMWENTINCCKAVLAQQQITVNQIAAIGITNQRETTILWHKKTGEPLYPAISWQDRRTADYCEQKNKNQQIASEIQEKTGLLLDPYFSATKISWILDHVPYAREQAEKGEILFGTVDTYLLWQLTKGQVHATDATNASRTLLFNIHTQKWDETLLNLFNIPQKILPVVHDSSSFFGKTHADIFGREIPITSVIGDQQAAVVGQVCFKPGMLKATYGTGGFIVLNTGKECIRSNHHLISTIVYRLNGESTYGLEGGFFSAGTIVKWLRDQLGLLHTASESEAIARSVTSTENVYLIPAFNGLGAPYWRPDVKAALVGLLQSTTKAHIVRAGLEAIAYQSRDLIEAFQRDFAAPITDLQVDGGMVANTWLLQFLADILNLKICRPRCIETTAMGAAFFAGLQLGWYQSLDEIATLWQADATFISQMTEEARTHLYANWQKAIKQLLQPS